ncbi:MAG TPA: pantoate--beta-alanine ligase [Candidatus Deferrimicrobium sp.]|nr:pantoate--beta-alanine ligase [Candidatus Deferrimicrobium sp.]
MLVIRSIRRMHSSSRKSAVEGRTIALVPTMGALHDGHISLIRRAKKAADVVITSIFVNPAQFGPQEDFRKYPRDEGGDIKKIASAGGDIVFIPRVEEIYPPEYQTYVTVENLTRPLEGAARPGHFRSVTTVVTKLFNICRPDVAVFGMKDYQQAIVLKRMTHDLGYPIKFIIAPTLRERDGLAMSSRNRYFTSGQRREALCLYYALRTARAMVSGGVGNVSRINKEMRAAIRAACPTATIDYIAFTDFASLAPVRTVTSGTICSLAVEVHGVRLIDNMKLA